MRDPRVSLISGCILHKWICVSLPIVRPWSSTVWCTALPGVKKSNIRTGSNDGVLKGSLQQCKGEFAEELEDALQASRLCNRQMPKAHQPNRDTEWPCQMDRSGVPPCWGLDSMNSWKARHWILAQSCRLPTICKTPCRIASTSLGSVPLSSIFSEIFAFKLVAARQPVRITQRLDQHKWLWAEAVSCGGKGWGTGRGCVRATYWQRDRIHLGRG